MKGGLSGKEKGGKGRLRWAARRRQAMDEAAQGAALDQVGQTSPPAGLEGEGQVLMTQGRTAFGDAEISGSTRRR